MSTPALVITGLEESLDALRRLPGRVGTSRIGPAIMAACQPTLTALKANTPRGPTGNLLRAATIKSVEYPNTGTVVVIVGYIRAGTAKSGSTGGKYRTGPDRAFHQHWIEEGTADRKLKKGPIASSLNTTGGFGGAYFKARGFNGKSFAIVDSPSGVTVQRIDGLVVFRPKGGVIRGIQAQHPMKKAFDATSGEVEQRAKEALLNALNEAVEELRGQ